MDSQITVDGNVISLPLTLCQFLFTYKCGELCPSGKAGFADLEAAVEHYVQLTVQRDGYYQAFDGVAVDASQDPVTITLTEIPDVDTYAQRLAAFMQVGVTGLNACQQMQADGKWQDSWSFFLMWGQAIQNHKTTQLLHFPPDNVPSSLHDDLLAATTMRWGRMLEASGAATGSSTWYQSVVDIFPIAAPASDGNQLDDVTNYVTDFANELFAFKVQAGGSSALPRPIVVFGSPAREWYANNYMSPNSTLEPLQLADTTINGVSGIPTLGANHPSDIYYQPTNWAGCTQTIMLQDAQAAYWQVGMGKAVADGTIATVADMMPYAEQLLSQAATYWNKRLLELCEIYWVTTYGVWPGDATGMCGPDSC